MKKKAISVVNDITAGKRNIDKLEVPEFSNKIELFAQKAQTKTVRKKERLSHSNLMNILVLNR